MRACWGTWIRRILPWFSNSSSSSSSSSIYPSAHGGGTQSRQRRGQGLPGPGRSSMGNMGSDDKEIDQLAKKVRRKTETVADDGDDSQLCDLLDCCGCWIGKIGESFNLNEEEEDDDEQDTEGIQRLAEWIQKGEVRRTSLAVSASSSAHSLPPKCIAFHSIPIPIPIPIEHSTGRPKMFWFCVEPAFRSVPDCPIFVHPARDCTTICKNTICPIHRPSLMLPFIVANPNPFACWHKHCGPD